MLASAVSSSTPIDFQPSSHMGSADRPVMNRQAPAQAIRGPYTDPYIAVGMQRALDSLIGLPSRSTSAPWMLEFLMPAEVRRSFMLPSGSVLQVRRPAPTDPSAVETDRPPENHRPPVTARLSRT